MKREMYLYCTGQANRGLLAASFNVGSAAAGMMAGASVGAGVGAAVSAVAAGGSGAAWAASTCGRTMQAVTLTPTATAQSASAPAPRRR